MREIRTPNGALTAAQLEALDAMIRGETPSPAQAELAALRAWQRRALAWLAEYGQHAPECGVVRGYPPCECGLDELRGGPDHA